MRKYVLLICLFSIFVFSCSKQKKNYLYEYVLSPIDEISFNLTDSSKNVLTDYQLFETDTAKLIFMYFKNEKISVYNFDNQNFIKTIPLKKNVPLFSFYVKTIDSIFLLYNSGFFFDYTDSVLTCIDFDGQLVENYFFENKYFKSLNNEIKNDSSYYPHTMHHKLGFDNQNSLFFLVSKYAQRELGDSNSRNSALPPIACYDIENKKLSFINLPFLMPPVGYFYPQAFNHYYVSTTKAGNPLLSYRYSSIFYEYNIATDSLIQHYLKSLLIDTIEPEKDKNNCRQLHFINNKGTFNKITYDKYRDIYFKTVLLPRKQYENSVFIVADNNFNKIGEGVIPTGHDSDFIFEKNHIFIWNTKKTFASEGKIYFTKFELKKQELEISDLKARLQEKVADSTNCTVVNPSEAKGNKPVIELLNKYIDKKNYTVLIVPFLYSCPSCKEYAIMLYRVNKEIFIKNDVFLFFDSPNISGIKTYLVENNLNMSNNMVLTDTFGLYNSYVKDNFYNPRLVNICNGKVTFDKTYKPDELEQIYDNIFSFIDNKCK